MIGNNISRVGCELEGGWLKGHKGHRIHGDGSLNFEKVKEFFGKGGIVGEKSSPVFSSENELYNWIQKEYPHRRNKTCGFHVNVSLADISLQSKLVSGNIHRAMIKSIVTYIKSKRLGFVQENRLKKGDYCCLDFNAGRKYSAINWSKVYHSGYIEYRIFSQVMPPQKAVNAVKFLVGLTDFVAESLKDKSINPQMLEEISNYKM